MGIGIDLGTQSCRVAVWEHGHATIIADDEGNRSFPSYVSFSKEGRFVGNLAKSKQTMNLHHTIYGVKRLLGRNFRDFDVQDVLRTRPFRSVNKGGIPCIQVEHAGKQEIFAPEEIIAMQLSKLKRMAETHIGGDCGHVAISIPPALNFLQRQAVKDACEIAGLQQAHLITETSASAMYYTLYSNEAGKVVGDRNILILDVGAGVSSASAMTIEDGIIEIKAASSNLSLGGDQFDDLLVDHVVIELRRKHSINLKDSPRAVARLRLACEKAKRALSGAQKAVIDLEGVSQDIPEATLQISRDEFDALCRDLYRDALKPVRDVLRQSNFRGSSLHEVILAGGATRIPGLLSTLSELLGEGSPVPTSIRNLDEAVAYGCAMRAAMLSDAASATFCDMILLDVVHHSLGVASLRGKEPQALPSDGGSPHENVLTKIIPRNMTSPTKKNEMFTTSHSDQTTIHVQVYEGDDEQPTSNIFLGSFELSRIQKTKHGKGLPIVQIEFDLSSDMGLVVSARDLGSSESRSRSLSIRVGRLSQFDKDDMKHRAKALDELDSSLESRTRRRNNLEEYCYNSQYLIAELQTEVAGCLRWLDDTASASVSDEEYRRREEALVAKVERMLPPGFVLARDPGPR